MVVHIDHKSTTISDPTNLLEGVSFTQYIESARVPGTLGGTEFPGERFKAGAVGDPDLSDYLRDISRYPQLQIEEERQLGKLIRTAAKETQFVLLAQPLAHEFLLKFPKVRNVLGAEGCLDLETRLTEIRKSLPTLAPDYGAAKDCAEQHKKFSTACEELRTIYVDLIDAQRDLLFPAQTRRIGALMNANYATLVTLAREFGIEAKGARVLAEKLTAALSEHADNSKLRGALADWQVGHTTSWKVFLKTVEKFQTVGCGVKDLRQRFYEGNLKLPVWVAKTFNNRGVPLLDLIQEGNMALMRAAEGFKPELGNKFSTYATRAIIQGISRGIKTGFAAIKTSPDGNRAEAEISDAIGFFEGTNGRKPSQDELLTALAGKHKGSQRAAKTGKRLPRVSSLSAPAGDSMEHGDYIEDHRGISPVVQSQKLELRKALLAGINRLENVERFVIANRFGISPTDGQPQPVLKLREVGDVLGVTRERVRQIEVKGLQKLQLFCPQLRHILS